MSTTKTPAQIITGYFGKKEGQTLQELLAELKQLSDTDKTQLCEGISSGTFTY